MINELRLCGRAWLIRDGDSIALVAHLDDNVTVHVELRQQHVRALVDLFLGRRTASIHIGNHVELAAGANFLTVLLADSGSLFPLSESATMEAVRFLDADHALRVEIDRLRATYGDEAWSRVAGDGHHTIAELYEHRHALLIALMRQMPDDQAWWSMTHADGTMHDGWFIAGISSPAGQISYHLPLRMRQYMDLIVELKQGRHWDGHTSDDVVERLLKFPSRHRNNR